MPVCKKTDLVQPWWRCYARVMVNCVWLQLWQCLTTHIHFKLRKILTFDVLSSSLRLFFLPKQWAVAPSLTTLCSFERSSFTSTTTKFSFITLLSMSCSFISSFLMSSTSNIQLFRLRVFLRQIGYVSFYHLSIILAIVHNLRFDIILANFEPKDVIFLNNACRIINLMIMHNCQLMKGISRSHGLCRITWWL